MKRMSNVKGNQFHIKKLDQTLAEMLHRFRSCFCLTMILYFRNDLSTIAVF